MTDLRSTTLKQLRALASTVRNGTVTGAARDLFVTPPAITTQLKLLRAAAGAPLFDRSRPGFVPSEVGRELLQTALEIERLLARANDRIAALRSGAAGSVTFGAVSTAKYFAPAIVAAFQRAHPGIRVKLVIGNRGEIISGLERNDFELLIMGRPPTHLALDSAELGPHPHILIAAPDHPLVRRPSASFEDLLRERFLAREPGSGTRALMEQFLEQIGAGRAFDIVDMGTNETIKQAVMAGLGIAIISAHTCNAELQAGKLVTVSAPGLPVVRTWHLIHRTEQPLSTVAAVMKSFLLEHRNDFMPGHDVQG